MEQARCPVLIGRHGELETLASLLRSRPADQGPLVLLAGEAGPGKTRLARGLVAAMRKLGLPRPAPTHRPGSGSSRREWEIAGLIAQGLSNREIADRLSIAERTAEGHVERTRNRLGCRSRAPIAAWYARHNDVGPAGVGPMDKQVISTYAPGQGPPTLPNMSPLNQLTALEFRVCLLVAQGVTNGEAAARLFISPKTIETHLSHAFSKLEVRSRTQLAWLMARQPQLTLPAETR